ncbi:MAG TPA: formyl transferase [Longimicrobiales bacterium]|nr:formyl transferase [Longimicrobiales bacterium]
MPAREPGPVVLLCGDGASGRIVWRALRRELPDVRVIVEAAPSRLRLLWRRARRVGALAALGQALFVALAVPLLRRAGARRIAGIRAEHGLDDSPFDDAVSRVPSVNAKATRERLRELRPAVVVVNGTRIIGRATLRAVDAPFVNMHAGITPTYRGVHGAYWALCDRRPDLVGTTVHLVDEGIDTGGVIEQATFAVSAADSFATYPYLHTAAGLPALVRAVRAALDGTLATRPAGRELPSRLHHHPTLWGYLERRVRLGIR